mgnify:CR=1 FL=1
MATNIHFIDVGQGNMVLIECANGTKFMFDCNIKDDNEDRVLGYVANCIGEGTKLHAFICSHRDADHMRGVKRLHRRFPIQEIWDSGYQGTSTDTQEYRDYMELRRKVGSRIIEKQTRSDYGKTRFRYLSAKDDRLSRNANAQGVVLKVQQYGNQGHLLTSTILPGDSDAETWQYGILKDYAKNQLSAEILMAAHHGSISFFDDPSDSNTYYEDHIIAISPEITVISVGPNNHGHPDSKALELYKKHSSGADNGRKIYRTDSDKTMELTLKNDGGWRLSPKQ